MKTPDQVLALLKEKLDEAVSSFGAYTLNDKGPSEVMNYKVLVYEMTSLEPEDARKVIEELYNYRDEDGTSATLCEWLLDDLGITLGEPAPPIATVQVTGIMGLLTHLPQAQQEEIAKRFNKK